MAVPSTTTIDRQPPALVAAGQRVRFSDKRLLERLRQRSEWQAEAWDYYDAIGGVRWAFDLVSRLAARSRIGLGWWPQRDEPQLLPDAPPSPLPEWWPEPELIVLAEQQLGRLLDGLGGADDLLGQLALHLGLVGESYVIGRYVRDPITGVVDELWSIHSGDSVTVKGDNVEVRTGPGQAERFELSTKELDDGTPEGFYARIWLRHPRYPDRPTTTLRATLEDCEELQLLRRVMRSSYRSRISAGVVFVAQELNGRAQLPVGGDGVAAAGDPEQGHDFAAEFLESIITPVNEEASDGGVAPWVVPAPAEQIANGGVMRHYKFGREITQQDLTERDSLDKRIAQGLPLPPEAVTGVGDVNHWTAWQVSEDLYRVGVAPVLDAALLGLTEAVFWPLLFSVGVTENQARKLCVWYDPTDAVARPDPIEKIATAFRDGVINAAAYRRHLPGVTDADAPTGTEIAGRILSGRGVLTAEATLALVEVFGGPTIELAGDDADVEAPAPVDDPATPDTTTPGLVAAAGRAAAAARAAQQLGEIERTLFRTLLVAADAAVTRIVERIGAQARSRGQRDPVVTASIRGLAAREVPRALGRTVVAALGVGDEDEIREGLTEFQLLWSRLVGDAAEQTVGILAGLATTPDEAAAVVRIAASYTAAVDTSATFVVELLLSDTLRALFDDVELDAAQLGEIDEALRVTPETLRRAISVAGGGEAAALDVGGLTGGQIATAAAAEAGLVRDGYTWVYGAGLRGAPFPPHKARDGLVFDDFEDRALATAGTGYEWVGAYFAPGDHAYCQCDAQPRFVPRGELQRLDVLD